MKQGEKLLILVRRDPRSSEEIAEAMGVDKSYLPKLYKLEKLPPKPLARAQEVFGVSPAYFTEIPEQPSSLAEPGKTYDVLSDNTQADIARLQQEMEALRAEMERLRTLLEHEKNVNAALSEAILHMSKRS